MKKEFRPLILETVEGHREFVNCYEIVTVTHCPVEDNYVVDATSKVGIRISKEAGESLIKSLTTTVFFSMDSIDDVKLLRHDGFYSSDGRLYDQD
ncbi:hypothetical protein [uncultured phage]|nr:hypothetical protein [uncultured phage]